jgi:DNA-binding MarR family transcriptional regulator
MDIEKVNWVKGGKYRAVILKLLAENPQLPSEIASSLSLARASVSRILRGMEKEGLVARTKSRTRTITYYLTDDAKMLLPLIDKARPSVGLELKKKLMEGR